MCRPSVELFLKKAVCGLWFAGVMQLAGVCMIGLELLLTVGVSFVKCILVVVLYFEKYSYLC